MCLLIVLAGGWYLLPPGYETIVEWLGPFIGNYLRPSLVLVNLLFVHPLASIMFVALWAGAGFVGGVIAGTKKGAVVVGISTWLSCLLILAFCAWQIMQSGVDLSGIPPPPPGVSVTDILGLPIAQFLVTTVVTMMAGGGGGPPPMEEALPSLLMGIAPFLLTPIVTVCVAAVLGAVVRPRE